MPQSRRHLAGLATRGLGRLCGFRCLLRVFDRAFLIVLEIGHVVVVGRHGELQSGAGHAKLGSEEEWTRDVCFKYSKNIDDA